MKNESKRKLPDPPDGWCWELKEGGAYNYVLRLHRIGSDFFERDFARGFDRQFMLRRRARGLLREWQRENGKRSWVEQVAKENR